MPKPTQLIALSAQPVELGGVARTEIKLFPSGTFKAKDGRPHGLDGWVLNDTNAAVLLSAAAAQQDNYLIDYDHQTLYTQANGQPAKAAGWFTALDWRPNDGLYATDVEWTAAAKAAIDAKEYRYISPVLTFDKKTGSVTGLMMAALVNYPALDGLNDLAAAHCLLTHDTETLTMDTDEIIERLRCLLNLPTLCTSADILAELDKLKTLITTADGKTEGLAAALSAQHTPDPSKFVPIESLSAMQAQLATLTEQSLKAQLSALIEPAIQDGRLLPPLKDWAERLGRSDLNALSTYLDAAKPIAALAGLQTGGKAPDAGKEKPTDAAAIADLATAYQTNQAALGILVDDIAAIQHITGQTHV